MFFSVERCCAFFAPASASASISARMAMMSATVRSRSLASTALSAVSAVSLMTFPPRRNLKPLCGLYQLIDRKRNEGSGASPVGRARPDGAPARTFCEGGAAVIRRVDQNARLGAGEGKPSGRSGILPFRSLPGGEEPGDLAPEPLDRFPQRRILGGMDGGS